MRRTLKSARPRCQACDRPIAGEVFRFTEVPSSAFCSLACRTSRTQVTLTQLTLCPITRPLPPQPTFDGPAVGPQPQGCTCGVFYENQTLVPKRHSLVAHCPRCGGVTVD